ncbi:AT-hook motif nuclear-localized protein 10-like isoform X2 [Primulina tabacum]|uniref:AT-hook motif nuclear-localized protein 10-like isoform X2 n=1 Tax=Primulina tabacum TaxID=48773 RepID=UPI003F5A7DEF
MCSGSTGACYQRKGRREWSEAVCVLSCNGAISNLTCAKLRHLVELQLMRSEKQDCGPSITLSGPNRRVLGGRVAGLPIAATPVQPGLGFLQVIVGSFVSYGHKERKFAKYMGSCFAPPKVNLGGIIGSCTSPSHGTPSESSYGPASSLDLSSG